MKVKLNTFMPNSKSFDFEGEICVLLKPKRAVVDMVTAL